MRHEDDLRAEAYANGGAVPLGDLLDHCWEIVKHPEAYGASVTEPVRALLTIVDNVANDVPGVLPERVFLRTTEL